MALSKDHIDEDYIYSEIMSNTGGLETHLPNDVQIGQFRLKGVVLTFN